MHTTLKNSSSIADVQPNSKNMVRFGVIGYGYWGPNVVRNLTSLEGSELMAVCDKSPAARRRMQKAHPGIAVATEASEILGSTDLVCRLLLEKKKKNNSQPNLTKETQLSQYLELLASCPLDAKPIIAGHEILLW